MCYIWVCVAYANNAQRERYLHAEGTLVIRRAYAQLDARSLRARWYSLCIRTHTLCARYSNVSGTVWERYEHGARTLVPPNLIHTPGKLCVCGLLSYAQRTQNQYANIWRGLNSASIMLQQLFRKYFRYARMTSLEFSKFNFSAAIINIYAQFAPVSRVVYSAYFTFQQLFESTSCMRKWRY